MIASSFRSEAHWRDHGAAAREDGVPLSRLVASAAESVPVGLEWAKAAGVLCGEAGTRDVVDASVVTVALACRAIVFTSDPEGIARLSAASDVKPGLVIRRV